jgi:hypothetical protein
MKSMIVVRNAMMAVTKPVTTVIFVKVCVAAVMAFLYYILGGDSDINGCNAALASYYILGGDSDINGSVRFVLCI